MSGLNNIRVTSSSKPKTWLIANELSKICQISDTFWISKISKSLRFWKAKKWYLVNPFESDFKWNSRELKWKIDKLNYVCKYSGCGIRKGDETNAVWVQEHEMRPKKDLNVHMNIESQALNRFPYLWIDAIREISSSWKDFRSQARGWDQIKTLKDCGKNHIEILYQTYENRMFTCLPKLSRTVENVQKYCRSIK